MCDYNNIASLLVKNKKQLALTTVAMFKHLTFKWRDYDNPPLTPDLETTKLTLSETRDLITATMIFCFGQWPDSDDKHEMAQVASKHADIMLAIASQIKHYHSQHFDCELIVDLMNQEDINIY
jgi:hypothetical protein